MIKIRLIGERKEIEDAVYDMKLIFNVYSVSEPYPCRGDNEYYRVYVEADIPTDEQVLKDFEKKVFNILSGV